MADLFQIEQLSNPAFSQPYFVQFLTVIDTLNPLMIKRKIIHLGWRWPLNMLNGHLVNIGEISLTDWKLQKEIFPVEMFFIFPK